MLLVRIQPSLRDLCNSEFGPGVETPGYSRRFLRNQSTQGVRLIHGRVRRKNCMLVDRGRMIWLLVPTLRGTFVNVTQLAVSDGVD